MRRKEEQEPLDPKDVMKQWLEASQDFKYADPADRPAIKARMDALHSLYCSLPH